MTTLNDFCDVTEGRYNLDAPWASDEWRYATDGRIAVRELNVGRKVPKAADIFTGFDPAKCTEPWPKNPAVKSNGMVVCRGCGGTGKAQSRCPLCGSRRCMVCKGTMEVEMMVAVIANRNIDMRCVEAIAGLGNVKFDPSGEGMDGLHFVAANGRQGIVCPAKGKDDGGEVERLKAELDDVQGAVQVAVVEPLQAEILELKRRLAITHGDTKYMAEIKAAEAAGEK